MKAEELMIPETEISMTENTDQESEISDPSVDSITTSNTGPEKKSEETVELDVISNDASTETALLVEEEPKSEPEATKDEVETQSSVNQQTGEAQM